MDELNKIIDRYTDGNYLISKTAKEEMAKDILDLLRVMRSKSATTSIPQERWGVHRTHCCFEHGCKYGDEDCPVELGLIKQDYPCEMCNDDF